MLIKIFGKVIGKAKEIATQAKDSVETIVEKTVDSTKEKITEGVEKVIEKTVEQVTDKVTDVKDALSEGTKKFVGDSAELAKDLLETGSDLWGNSSKVVQDLTEGNVPITSIWKAVTELTSDLYEVAGDSKTLAQTGFKNLSDLYTWAKEGDSLLLGDPDGFLGVNLIGSILGGNKDQGIIPDSRGITGPVPFKIVPNGLGVDFGGEIPINQILSAFAAVNPYTASFAPTLAAINLGGIGITGRLDTSGITFKVFGIAGPSYDAGVASGYATAEAGNYSKLQLLSWNNLKVKDLPLLGSILGQIPLIKEISIPVAKINIQIDSKLYAQFNAAAELLGVGPKGQVELIHDLDNDIRKIFGIAKDTTKAIIDESGKVLAVVTDNQDSPAPNVEVIGNAPAETYMQAA